MSLNDLRNKINDKACGKRYRVKYRLEGDGQSFWITGTLINYESGNLDLITDADYVIHIPYSGLRWLLPVEVSVNRGGILMSTEEVLGHIDYGTVK